MNYATNPMEATISEAETIIVQLNASANRLANAIEDEQTIFARLKDAEQAIADSETEIVAESAMLAKVGEGELAGVAATSKAYGYVLDALKLKARTNGMAHIAEQMRRLKLEHEAASISRQQAEVHFSSMKRIAELKAAILRASSM